MITLAFLLDHQVISRSDKNTVVAGSKNYVRARFILRTDDWARTLCAFWGQLKYTDSIYFCQTYDAYRIFKAARRSVAWKARKEAQRGAVCQKTC